MQQLKNLEKLNSAIRKIVEIYAERLLELHGKNIASIVIYGSAAGSDFIPGVSDINIAVVLEHFDFDDMKRSLQLTGWGLKKRINAPLFLKKDYVKASTDVFPIEFLEIKENHVLIFGEDIFSSLNIVDENLRLFCEQQIKGKTIRINQAYLETGLKRRSIEPLLKSSLQQLFPVFRNILRLKGIKPAISKIDILDQVCKEFDLDMGVFVEIVRSKKYKQRMESKNLEGHLKKFLSEIEKLAVKIDRL